MFYSVSGPCPPKIEAAAVAEGVADDCFFGLLITNADEEEGPEGDESICGLWSNAPSLRSHRWRHWWYDRVGTALETRSHFWP